MPHNSIEHLEPRLALSASLIGGASDAPNISLRDGTLTVRGTSGPDRISVKPGLSIKGGTFQFLVQVRINGEYRTFKQSDIQHIVIDGGAGNDLIKLQSPPTPCPYPEPTVCGQQGTVGAVRINGGAGNDTIVGSNGNDTLDGGSGDDLIYGAAGNDHIFGRDGNDRIYGGDGADHVSGGAGIDKAWESESADRSTEKVTLPPPDFTPY